MAGVVGKSRERLDTVKSSLAEVVEDANEIMELSVLCGVRSREEQEECCRKGTSKLHWPDSNHNVVPPETKSRAVDIIPYFIEGKSSYDWQDELAFARLAGVMFACAAKRGVKIRWGGDWDNDGRSRDERFHDLPHFEEVDE